MRIIVVLFAERATMNRVFLTKPFRWPVAGDLLRHRSHDKTGLSFQSRASYHPANKPLKFILSGWLASQPKGPMRLMGPDPS